MEVLGMNLQIKNLDEFLNVLEYLGMVNEDEGYETLKLSSHGIDVKFTHYTNFLKRNNLTEENYTTLKQLEIIDRIYKRKFKGEII